MRQRHFEFILSQQQGVRIEKYSLAGCVECHVTLDEKGAYLSIDAKGQFCESCHSYAAVSIDCFDCHESKPEAAVSKEQTFTADHTQFEVLQKPFKSGPEVTKACLSCHTEASKQLHKTKHWSWHLTHPETGQTLGKRHVVNNFYGSVITNYERCTSCHIGYGWKDESFDFTSEENVDCLVCHDTTDSYRKFPADAEHPPYLDQPFPKSGKEIWRAPDLSHAAQHVGKPRRKNCGACHFYADGGDGVKHGDLDSSLANPKQALDVHMGTDGLNFSCTVCHSTESHDIKGSRYTMVAKDTHGIDVPGRDDGSRATCESCHGATPHKTNPHKTAVADKLNEHTDRVACQTCHIPYYAKGGVATKTRLDWSTAGKLDPDGRNLMIEDPQGQVTYTSKMGDSAWGENLVPEYAWFSGEIRYKELGEKIDPDETIALNTFKGSHTDPDARIWPFKAMRGKQPYDAGNQTLAIAHLFGDNDAAYWKSFNWNTAIKVAMDAAGADYSGEHGFIETTMHLPLTHMIATKEEALGCDTCHSRDGRLSQLDGLYMPGRDRSKLLDLIGWLVVLGTLAGVAVHGIARLVFASKSRKN
ncbi:MAG: tetrathionate reductase family octaheme c-type cytochrome [Gammaproteobacteria bacterium]|nr:tetrathionate reductase family octaheme c-type cytochrome [Gammaproteobacteria bacterium]